MSNKSMCLNCVCVEGCVSLSVDVNVTVFVCMEGTASMFVWD